MATPEPDPVDLAARALQHRDRSRHELDERLARAGIGADERAAALDTLARVGVLDDGRFAAARAEALASRGCGDKLIRHDLAGHGLDPEQIDGALAALEPEPERARDQVRRLGLSEKTVRRLARKGFGQDAIAGVLHMDIAQEGP
jgi:regulatory protein